MSRSKNEPAVAARSIAVAFDIRSRSLTRIWYTIAGLLLATLGVLLPALGQERFTLKGHTLALASVAYSRDGKFIATGSYDRTAKVWDAATGKDLATVTGHGATVEAVAFSPDGKTR